MKTLLPRIVTLIALTLLTAAHGLKAQTVQPSISIRLSDVTLEEAIREIEKVSGVYMSYDPSLLRSPRKVKYTANGKPLEEILRSVLTPYGLSYKIIGEQVVIQKPKVIKKYNISGTIKDNASGETLIGAVITVKELPGIGTTTNAYGFFSLPLSEGGYTLRITYIGYHPLEQEVSLTDNKVVTFSMQPATTQLKEAVVEESKSKHVSGTQVGTNHMTAREIRQIPVIFGESDVIKALQLLPGVKSAAEGSAGFYVRGGNADENLVLLDEATVYNPTHLLGFFSVFNTDALKDVTLHKGSMPAEYGGRLSSVLDIKMKDGNARLYEINGGIGLIASRLSVEGPIVKDKGSFMVSGRRTYADLFLKLSSDANTRKTKLFFYDLNAKAHYSIGKRDKLFVSGYYGRDVFDFQGSGGIDWGNGTASLRWNHIYNNKMFSNTTFIFSDFNFQFFVRSESQKFSVVSGVRDYRIKHDMHFYPSERHNIKAGFSSSVQQFIPGLFKGDFGIEIPDSIINFEKRYAWENAVYAQDEVLLWNTLRISYGVRLVAFSILGPGTYRTFDKEGKPTSSQFYTSGKFVKTYWNAEPRIAASIVVNPSHSFKVAYNRSVQNIHQLSNSTGSMPMDAWMPSTKYVKQATCEHVSLGYFASFWKDRLELSVEGYYKHMFNLIDYRSNTQIFLQGITEDAIVLGVGRAYGAEFLLRKRTGRVTGWVGYTYSRTERKFEQINNNNWFPAKQDRTHEVSVVLNFRISQRWSVGANFVYYTGNAITFPTSKYEINGDTYFYYSERNGFRMPDYHRLDLSVSYERTFAEKFTHGFTLSIYNVYSRRNPYFLAVNTEGSGTTAKTKVKQFSLFPIIPSVTYNFKIIPQNIKKKIKA